MPTGYTHKIKDGISFNEYAYGCARAFGALVTMRDDPQDAPIPEKFEPSDYSAKRLAESTERLSWLQKMPAVEADREAGKAYQEALATYEKYVDDCAKLKANYESILVDVRAYVAPSPDHVEYKKFMEDQVVESVEWDCKVYSDKPERLTGAQWLETQTTKENQNIEYHAEENRKEIERTEKRNEWVRLLHESLKGKS